MKLTLTSIVAVAALGITTAAEAAQPTLKEGRCLVVYNDSVYIDGTCTIAMGGHGTFSVGYPNDKEVVKHIAFVILNGDKSVALMNAKYFDAKAAWIGDVTRDGACWGNAVGKVCAWDEE